MMPMMLPAMTPDDTPVSISRAMAPAAELACKVENTRWPVIAARNAISAVSASRISPMRMMSGSCRSRLRTPPAKVRRAASLTEVWRILSIGYSTGSSRVMMLTDSVSR